MVEHYFDNRLLEVEPTTSKLIIKIIRHGKKGKATDGMRDREVLLTEAGLEDSRNKGRATGAKKEVSVAYGSKRKRGLETATAVMAPDDNELLEQIRKKDLNKNYGFDSLRLATGHKVVVGPKLVMDDRLGFTNYPTIVRREMTQAYNRGEMMQYTVRDSDRRAEETNDLQSSTYSRLAAGMAEFVKEKIRQAHSFYKIVKKNPKKYSEFGNQMERYAGTHQGNAESFVAKALEKIEGGDVEKRDEFLKKTKGGFKETEGCDIEIINEGENQRVILKYNLGDKSVEVEIDEDILDMIITDRDALDKRIKEKSNNIKI